MKIHDSSKSQMVCTGQHYGKPQSTKQQSDHIDGQLIPVHRFVAGHGYPSHKIILDIGNSVTEHYLIIPPIKNKSSTSVHMRRKNTKPYNQI